MFELKKTVARNTQTDVEDTANVKFALTGLGYYDDTETGLSPYGDNQLFQSVQAFQDDNDLKKDGVIKPKGPTHTKIKEKLREDPKAGNALADFVKNRKEMIRANTKNADKYFHCKANYEATQRGWDGFAAANILSDLRETIFAPKEILKIGLANTIKDAAEDQKANRYGRAAARSGKYKSAKEACAIHRPDGLDEKY